jgi:hypothetical protein
MNIKVFIILYILSILNCKLELPKGEQDIAFLTYVSRIKPTQSNQNATPTSNTTSANLVFSNSSNLQTNENGQTASFTISLSSEPKASVTVLLSSSNITEGLVAPTSINFTNSNWNTPQTITITGQNDSLFDGSKSYSIQFTINSTDTNYSSLTIPSISVTNFDNDKLTFVTTSTLNGNLGGITGADSLCNSDANKPVISPSIYKAFLVDSTGNRRASTNVDATGANPGTQVDWVLAANTTYFRANQTTPLFTTNSQKLFNLSSGVLNSFDPLGNSYWTGIKNDWTTNFTCLNWVNSTMGQQGDRGDGSATNSDAVSFPGPLACNSTLRVFCIQQ